MFTPKLAPWPEMVGGWKSHPLTYDEAFERSKASIARFRWNYALVTVASTFIVLMPHPKLIIAASFVVYMAVIFYTDAVPAPSFVRGSVPLAHRPVVLGCFAAIVILCTDLIGLLIVGVAVGGAVCAMHAVYVEPPVSFDV